MKLMLLIDTFVLALLAVATDALPLRGSGGKEEAPRIPDYGSAFRSDTTLRFMRNVHVPQVVAKQQHLLNSKPAADARQVDAKEAEVDRSSLCVQHGFKVAERAGCVAFMRQACRHSTHLLGKPEAVHRKVPLESCVRFFKEEQPGFQKGKVESGKDEQKTVGIDMKDWQQGPQYDSKKAQKATDKAEDGNKQDATAQNPLEQLGQAITDAANSKDTGEVVQKAPKKEKAEEAPEEPEDKETPSVPGCRNSPKGWEDAKGRDCEDYAEGEWCTRHGGYGDAWLDDWGTFEDVINKGKSAKQACCVCGGGNRKDEEESVEAKGSAPAADGAPAPAIAGPILGTKKGRALQSQGYSGELVAHEDRKTMTDDWGLEFGPHAGHRDVKSICADHPGNEWCSLHGYYDKERSAASVKCLVGVVAALFFACLR